jgi:hypothetical protein
MKLKTLTADFCYLWYTVFHPFNGFYELRFRRKRAWPLIALIYLLGGVTAIFEARYSGFLIRGGMDFYRTSNWSLFFTALFVYILFAGANWCVTTLFDGNGSLGDILMVLAYALLPRLVTDVLFVILSNFVISEEVILLYALRGAGIAVFCFLVFAGLCVVHQYSAAKNIVSLAATAVAIAVIMFIGMLYVEIMSKVIGFVTVAASELTKRW